MTPGNRIDRIFKALHLSADSLVIDLEDGVPLAQKASARDRVAEVLGELAPQGQEICIRINGLVSGEWKRDLDALPLERIDALMIPKVEGPEDIRVLDQYLDELGAKLDLILSIETPRGLLNALSIADASPRASALFFGSGDYVASTGAQITSAALQVPRSLIVAAAASAGLQAIDAAFFAALRDPVATRADAIQARELGFTGKLVFHPNQIEVVNEVFTPTQQEVRHAHRIISAYETAIARGDALATIDGQLVAIDIVLQAQRTLRRADQVRLKRERLAHSESS